MQSKASAIKPMRTKRDMGPLLPFEDLMNSIPEDECCKQDEDCKSNASEDYKLPDPCVLLHITNRRKVPPKKKDLPRVCNLALPLSLCLHDKSVPPG